MDGEMHGIAMAWEVGNEVVVVKGTQDLSWIETLLKQQMQERLRKLMRVKGHSGVEGNEQAD